MYILCHNKVLIVRHFLVRITYCTCVFVVCFVIMALHSLLFFRLIWKRYWRRYAPTTWRHLIATCGSSSLSTGTTKNSSPPDDLQLPTRVKVICTFCHAVLRLSFQNFTKHHFHVYLHPSLDYKGVSRRFWDSATVIQVIVIKTWKNTRWFLFYYFIDFKKLVFFSTTVTNELEFSMCTS